MKHQYKVVIVEDDLSSSSSLEIMLKQYFSNIIICGVATSVLEAKELIIKVNPDLVFLDIDLPDGSGFDIIDNSNPINYDIIFTTAFNEFAVRAFQFSAIHYILKPIEAPELIEAVNRFLKTDLQGDFENKFKILKESINDKPQKIMLPSSEGYNMYNISDIIKCEADSSYTFIYFNNGEKIMISKPINNFEKILCELGFSRVHNKYLVNMRYIQKYKKAKVSVLILTDGSELPISKTYKVTFEEDMKHSAKLI
jgi:two-component system LytT family response regulator